MVEQELPKGPLYIYRNGTIIAHAQALTAHYDHGLAYPLLKLGIETIDLYGGLRAIHITTLVLTEDSTRNIVAGKTPFELFRGATLHQMQAAGGLMLSISMVWGDFALYIDGSPTMREFVAVPGELTGFPDPETIAMAARIVKDSRIAL